MSVHAMAMALLPRVGAANAEDLRGASPHDPLDIDSLSPLQSSEYFERQPSLSPLLSFLTPPASPRPVAFWHGSYVNLPPVPYLILDDDEVTSPDSEPVTVKTEPVVKQEPAPAPAEASPPAPVASSFVSVALTLAQLSGAAPGPGHALLRPAQPKAGKRPRQAPEVSEASPRRRAPRGAATAWTQEDDARLSAAMADARLSTAMANVQARGNVPIWEAVAQAVPGRSNRQCQQLWSEYLDPTLDRTPLTPEEKSGVDAAVATIGKRWATMRRTQFKNRAAGKLKNYWNSKQRMELRANQGRIEHGTRARRGGAEQPANAPSNPG